jgi:hypothetical protein
MVVERIAAPAGETLIAGPFATEAEAKAALDTAPGCENRNDDKSGTAKPATPN